MHPLPKTHIDHSLRRYPSMCKQVIKTAAALTPDAPALTMDEVFADFRPLIDIGLREATWALSSNKRFRAQGLGIRDAAAIVRTPDMVMALGRIILMIHNFTRFGSKAFHFSEPLVERLEATELNVSAALLEPPFPSCVFAYDDPTTRRALAPLFDGHVDAECPITVQVTRTKEVGRGEDVLMIEAWQSTEESVGSYARRMLRLRDDSRVEDALNTVWEEPDPEFRDPWLDKTDPAKRDEFIIDKGASFYKIVANSILYLNSAHPDISKTLVAGDVVQEPSGVSSTKHARFREATSRASSVLTYVQVGAKMPPMPANDAENADPVTRGKLNERQRVRGHWKVQAHGPGRSERKTIHVEPYWRGPDAAEVISRPYMVTLRPPAPPAAERDGSPEAPRPSP